MKEFPLMPINTFYQNVAIARSICEKRTPFLMPMIYKQVIIYDPKVATAQVTYETMIIHLGNAIAHMTPDKIATILAHEALHPTLKHQQLAVAVQPVREELVIWGIAVDIPINDMLTAAGYVFPTFADFGCEEKELPPGKKLDDLAVVLASMFGFPEHKSVPWYFEELKKQLAASKPNIGNTPMEGNDIADQQSQSGNADDLGDPNDPYEQLTKQLQQMGRTQEEIDSALEAVAAKLEEMEKTQGTLPGHLKLMLSELRKPPIVDYQKLLRYKLKTALTKAAGMTHTHYRTHSKRQAGLGYGVGACMLPALEGRKPTVGVILDVSGSMLGGDLESCLNEIQGVLTQMKAAVQVVTVDTAVHNDIKITDIKALINAASGGGGSDLCAAFSHFEAAPARHERVPDIVLCMTDGYCSVPSTAPIFPCILISTTLAKPTGTRGQKTDWFLAEIHLCEALVS